MLTHKEKQRIKELIENYNKDNKNWDSVKPE